MIQAVFSIFQPTLKRNSASQPTEFKNNIKNENNSIIINYKHFNGIIYPRHGSFEYHEVRIGVNYSGFTF